MVRSNLVFGTTFALDEGGTRGLLTMGKRYMKSSHVYVVVIVSLLTFNLMFYQNCNGRFKPISSSDPFSSEGNGGKEDNSGGIPFDEPMPTGPQKPMTYSVFKTCLAQDDELEIRNCIIANDSLPEGLSSLDLKACSTSVGKEQFAMANCLYRKGFLVFGYREFSQIDLNDCQDSSSEGIANCIANRGLTQSFGEEILSDVSTFQSEIDTCLAGGNFNQLESCLRTAGILSQQRNALIQYDVDYCKAVVGDDADVPDCVRNRVNISATAAAQIENCIDSDGVFNVRTCLARGERVPRTAHQEHIDSCISSQGLDSLASCLRRNGFAATLEQTDVSTCVEEDGLAALASCLRSKNLLETSLARADLEMCDRINGQAGIMNCLSSNGFVTFNGLTQADIDQCITTDGLANADNCLKDALFTAYDFSELAGNGGVFRNNCRACHRNGRARGGLNFDQYNTVVQRIMPGSDTNSLIYQRMTDTANPMPQAGNLADANLIEQVRLWILAGGRNN